MHLISGYELWGTPIGFTGIRMVKMDGRHVVGSAFDMHSSQEVRVLHGARVIDIPYTTLNNHGNVLLTAGFNEDLLEWYVWNVGGIDPVLLEVWCEQDIDGPVAVPDYVTKAHAMGVAAGYREPVFVLLDADKEPSYYID